MATYISANYVFRSRDPNGMTVGFADNQVNTQEYILFQRSTQPSEHEKRLGHDKVHVTVNDQIRACYGGITSIDISNNKVVFWVDMTCAHKLRTETQIIVCLGDKCQDIGAIRKLLLELFSKELSDGTFAIRGC